MSMYESAIAEAKRGLKPGTAIAAALGTKKAMEIVMKYNLTIGQDLHEVLDQCVRRAGNRFICSEDMAAIMIDVGLLGSFEGE